jgi:dTDP-4-dehydrorhamnose reductase
MIWLIGNKGMLGTELSALFESRSMACVGTDRDVDITDTAALDAFAARQAASGSPIDWIVNCAAYTAVDKAEDDTALCRALNTDGPANIAACAKKIGARLVHISTDYVFHGDGTRPYRENDPTDPTGVYGLTKRDGEIAALAANDATYIIRTAWLYGRHGNNFVYTMLRLMKERGGATVVNDQRGTPTWAWNLADTVATLIAKAGPAPDPAVPYGIYHYTNKGNITWYDFACEIYRQARATGLLEKDCTISPCTSEQFPAKVKRPCYSVLDKTKIETALGVTIPEWQESLDRFMRLS